jgi:hypothetical protein
MASPSRGLFLLYPEIGRNPDILQIKKPLRPEPCGFFHNPECRAKKSALTRLEAPIGFVDHINASFTAYNAAITMALFRGLERVQDFHGPDPKTY